jgi:DNA-binding CsgD family transcriptional regulator
VTQRDQVPYAALAARVRSVVGIELPDPASPDYDGQLGRARLEVERIVADASAPLTTVEECCRCLLWIDEVQQVIEASRRRTRTTQTLGLRALSDFLARSDAEEPWGAATDELCAAMGFPRVMVSTVRDDRWTPRNLYIRPASEPAGQQRNDAVRDFVCGATWELSRAPVEMAVLRDRTPSLVADPQTNTGTFKPLMQVTETQGYVLASVGTRRRTVGLLHGDRWGSPVRESDRDLIAAYAEGLGVAVEHAALRRWFRQLPEPVAETLRHTAGTMTRPGPAGPVPPNPPASLRSTVLTEDAADRSDLGMLSTREREVLVELAAGLTNTEIARRLGLSLETVKSYVAAVLRKLEVPSRAAAVALFVQGRSPGDGRPARSSRRRR